MKQFPICRLAHRAKSIIFFGGAPLLAARHVLIIATFALVVVSCSEVVTPSTNNAVQPIRNLKLVQTDRQSIMVTWTNPDDAFDSIHVLSIDDSSNALIGDRIVITDGSQSTTIDKLTINTKYTVVVVAYNNGKESAQQSKYITITPLVGAVSELSTEIGDGAVTLSWTNPSEPNFSHVEIVYAPTNNTDDSTSMTVRIPGTDGTSGTPGATETTTITGLTNGTEYTFTITTHHSDGTSTDITTTATPIAPMVSDLRTEIGDGAITLSWTNPSESNFSHVEIVYAPTNGGASMMVRIPGTDPGTPGAMETTTITGLTNGTEYTFTIMAYNSDGISTDTPTTATPVAPPVDAVSDLRTEIGDGEITLSWTNPSESNFSHVEIVYAPTSGGASMTVRILGTDGAPGVPGATETTTITGLTNDSEYTFTVNVYDTDDGITPSTITATPIAPMVSEVSALSTEIGDRKITLSWTNPSEPNFSHVEIVYAPTSGGASMTVRIPETDGTPGIPGATETTTITGLTNDSEYTFTIMAYNSDGISTDTPTTATPVVPPMVSAVSALSTEIGDGEITLNWTNPSEPNFSHVEIVYAPTNGGASMTVRIPGTDGAPGMPGATETTTITGLTNGSEYTFTIMAYNSDGISTDTPTTATPRDMAPPNPVTDLLAVLSDRQQVTVSWTNPSDTDFGYANIDYGVSGTGDTTRIRVPDTGFGTSDATGSVVIPDLIEGADYSFTVISYDREEPANSRPSSNPISRVLLSSEVNPYTIVSLTELQSIATGFSNAQITTPLSKKASLAGHYRLANSLTVGNFTSIGDNTMAFSGTFDGDGNTLMNLRINSTTSGSWGLFGVVRGGTIGNLQLDNPIVTGSGNVGALVGLLTASGTVRYSASIGGRVNGGSSNDVIGGLVGSNNGTVTNSYASANADDFASGSINGLGADDRVGGLIGVNNAMGMVTNSYATGSVNGGGGNNDHVGGLIGWNHGIIRSSYAAGNATGGEGVNNNVGRLLGSHSAQPGQVTHAYYYDSALISVGRDLSLGDPRSHRQLTSGDIMDLPGFTAADWEFESTKLPAIKGVAGQPFALSPPGTADVPYLVRNADELQSIATGFSNAQTDTPLGLADSLAARYRVVSNIDLSSIGNFLPIGTDTTPFNGTFDGGNNHGVVISGLTINSTEYGFWGLFGTVSGTVRNVALNNIAVTGGGRAGALMGKLSSGAVTNSHATNAEVTGRDTHDVIGGLIGENNGGTVANSYTENTTVNGKDGNDDIGGLIGENSGGTITDSYAENPRVDGSNGNDDVGGLIGQHINSRTSEAIGIIISSHANGIGYGGNDKDNLGGLVGNNFGEIYGSYAKTTMLVAGKHDDSVGGLVGYNGGGTIENNYATGKADGADGGDHVGGLVGLIEHGTIENNYATGEANGGGSGDAIGGLIGAHSSGMVKYNYVTGKVHRGGAHVHKEDSNGIIGRTGSSDTDLNTNYHNSDASIHAHGDGYGNEHTSNELRTGTPSSDIYTGWSTTHWDFGDGNALPKVRYRGILVPGQ